MATTDECGIGIAKGAVAGFIAGLVASWVMNQFQSTLSKLLEGEEKPHGAQSIQKGSPDHGAGAELKQRGLDDPDDNAAERTANYVSDKLFDHQMSESEKHIGGAIAHYAFGASTGAFYGAVCEVIPEAKIGVGLPFGAAVWVAADEIVVPALGLSKSAKDYPLYKHVYALTSHLVYGLTTELCRRALRNRI